MSGKDAIDGCDDLMGGSEDDWRARASESATMIGPYATTDSAGEVAGHTLLLLAHARA